MSKSYCFQVKLDKPVNVRLDELQVSTKYFCDFVVNLSDIFVGIGCQVT